MNIVLAKSNKIFLLLCLSNKMIFITTLISLWLQLTGRAFLLTDGKLYQKVLSAYKGRCKDNNKPWVKVQYLSSDRVFFGHLNVMFINFKMKHMLASPHVVYKIKCWHNNDSSYSRKCTSPIYLFLKEHNWGLKTWMHKIWISYIDLKELFKKKDNHAKDY
jgi:hypothetical protein